MMTNIDIKDKHGIVQARAEVCVGMIVLIEI
jgi:hypothetical protein